MQTNDFNQYNVEMKYKRGDVVYCFGRDREPRKATVSQILNEHHRLIQFKDGHEQEIHISDLDHFQLQYKEYRKANRHRDRSSRERRNTGPPKHGDAVSSRRKQQHNSSPVRPGYTEFHHSKKEQRQKESREPPDYDDALRDIVSFIPHFKLSEAREECFKGTMIDHQDSVGHFLPATIIDNVGTNCHISYDGWKEKWNTWSDYTKELERFARLGSISKRPVTRPDLESLVIGDAIDINSPRHPGWVKGQIRRLDIDKASKRRKSGQVQVQYRGVNASSEREFLYWVHLDNESRVQPFPTMSSRKYADEEDDPPKYAEMEEEEEVKHTYTVEDWIDVRDERRQWCPATILEVRGNILKIHFADWSADYDCELHAVRDGHRIRPLGSGLSETENEKEIREVMFKFSSKLLQQELDIQEVKADGNCLYRGFAVCIYGNEDDHERVRQECCEYMYEQRKFFENFIPDFEEAMAIRAKQYEWGDHVDIIAMSERYNVRVHIYEYDKERDIAYRTLEQGGEIDLPLVLLSRHREKHYNILLCKGGRSPFIGDQSKAATSIQRERMQTENEPNQEDTDSNGLSWQSMKRPSSLRSSARITQPLNLTGRDMDGIMLSVGLKGDNIPTAELETVLRYSLEMLEKKVQNMEVNSETLRRLQRIIARKRNTLRRTLEQFQRDKKHDSYWPSEDWVSKFNDYIVRKELKLVLYSASTLMR